MDEMTQIWLIFIVGGLVFGTFLFFLRKLDLCKEKERSYCLRSYTVLLILFLLFFGSIFVIFIIDIGLKAGAVFPAAVLSMVAYWFFKTPYELSIDEDGTLTLKHIFHQTRVKPGELRSLKRTGPFIKLSYAPAGTTLIPIFRGRHGFINLLKEANPDVNIQDL